MVIKTELFYMSWSDRQIVWVNVNSRFLTANGVRIFFPGWQVIMLSKNNFMVTAANSFLASHRVWLFSWRSWSCVWRCNRFRRCWWRSWNYVWRCSFQRWWWRSWLPWLLLWWFRPAKTRLNKMRLWMQDLDRGWHIWEFLSNISWTINIQMHSFVGCWDRFICTRMSSFLCSPLDTNIHRNGIHTRRRSSRSSGWWSDQTVWNLLWSAFSPFLTQWDWPNIRSNLQLACPVMETNSNLAKFALQ